VTDTAVSLEPICYSVYGETYLLDGLVESALPRPGNTGFRVDARSLTGMQNSTLTI
jgi:hypothetical protein